MKKNNDYFLLTGASKGIGKATLDLLIKKKEKVIVIVRNKKEMDDYKKNHDIIIFQGDVCNNKTIKKIFQFINKNKLNIKYLINNAGQRQRKEFIKISDKEIKKIFEINFFSIFFVMQIFSKYFIEKKISASIVNIGSIVGHLGFKQLSGYASTKSAIEGLTKSFANEMSDYKIRANVVSPGFTKTSYFSKFKKKKSLYKWTISRIPMKRWAEPKEISSLICFLLSNESSYITGENIKIDGGWTNA